MKCSGENVIQRGIFHVVSCFPLHFMLYRGNLDYFLDSVHRPWLLGFLMKKYSSKVAHLVILARLQESYDTVAAWQRINKTGRKKKKQAGINFLDPIRAFKILAGIARSSGPCRPLHLFAALSSYLYPRHRPTESGCRCFLLKLCASRCRLPYSYSAVRRPSRARRCWRASWLARCRRTSPLQPLRRPKDRRFPFLDVWGHFRILATFEGQRNRRNRWFSLQI